MFLTEYKMNINIIYAIFICLQKNQKSPYFKLKKDLHLTCVALIKCVGNISPHARTSVTCIVYI